MTQIYYKDEHSLRELDEVLNATDEVLKTDRVLLIGGNTVSSIIGTSIGGALGQDMMLRGLASMNAGFISTAAISGKISIFKRIANFLKKIFFKKQYERELLKKKLARLEKVVEKQNRVYEQYKSSKEKLEKAFSETMEENEALKEKIIEYEVILEVLFQKVNELQSDLNMT